MIKLITTITLLLIISHTSAQTAHLQKRYDQLLKILSKACDPATQSWNISGRLTHTKRKLDIAIIGKGFLKVRDPKTGKTFFTRDGRLTINKKRELALKSGHILHPTIQLPLIYTISSITIKGQTLQGMTIKKAGSLARTTYTKYSRKFTLYYPKRPPKNRKKTRLYSFKKSKSIKGELRQGWLEKGGFNIKKTVTQMLKILTTARKKKLSGIKQLQLKIELLKALKTSFNKPEELTKRIRPILPFLNRSYE